MAGIQNASLRHAAYYVQLLYQHNQGYLRGGEEQASALHQFEIELPNLRSVQERLPGLLDPLEKKHELSQMD